MLSVAVIALIIFSGCTRTQEDLVLIKQSIAGSKAYTGIYPIDVNNDSNTISIDLSEIGDSNLTAADINGIIGSIVKELIPGKDINISCTGSDNNGICTISFTGSSGTSGKTYTGLSPINVDNDLNIIELLYTQDFNDIYKGGGGGSAGRTYTGISPIVVDNDANTISSDYNHKDYNIGYLQVQGNARFLGDLNVGSGSDQVSIGKDSNKLCFPQGLACLDWNGEALVMRTVDLR
jgi:hypothetical protein